MDPITVESCTYVLELENGMYYVGSSYNLNFRYAQHISGHGSGWTKLHKPKGIVKVIIPGSLAIENDITREYMTQHGKEKVRGGSYCKV